MRAFINLIFCFLLTCAVVAQDISIIPQPAHLVKKEGSFVLTKNTSLIIPDEADMKTAVFLNSYLKRFYGIALTVKKQAGKNSIQINTKRSGEANGYTFESNPDGISITGATHAGSFYGMQTLIQLLPVQRSSPLKISSVRIEDAPRFAYRGMLLDVGRYFYSVEFVKKYIDFIALHKMNYFHWHLTDDPGWRIEIKKYPDLTNVGAWRNKTNIFQFNDTTAGDEHYGGYYTQEDIRDIVQYANDRYITIIPEIEMPAHSLSALASYPELGCTGGPYEMPEKWTSYLDVFCAGNEKTFEFIENVLDEVMALFPSPYIHIGGDECPKDRWKTCPKCQARIKNENLKDEHELQSYFIKRIEKYINSKGRTMIGWDEILEGGLAPNAVVMSWRGESGGIAAAQAKHTVIMTPSRYCYFDYPQKENAENVPDWMKLTTADSVYMYEPVPKELSKEASRYVLGGQGNIWTEFISNPARAEYMMFPRMSALSEVLWSPKDKRNIHDFKTRMMMQFKRYDLWGTNYCKTFPDSTSSAMPTKN
ncbi:MAG TPA: beta-N-acetylhexosaminidase [Parafilimonas sp.]|nr:beta-N-acetylhexosaminidase [Parafilimonas sp.]